jgi:hypothetical protein
MLNTMIKKRNSISSERPTFSLLEEMLKEDMERTVLQENDTLKVTVYNKKDDELATNLNLSELLRAHPTTTETMQLQEEYNACFSESTGERHVVVRGDLITVNVKNQ